MESLSYIIKAGVQFKFAARLGFRVLRICALASFLGLAVVIDLMIDILCWVRLPGSRHLDASRQFILGLSAALMVLTLVRWIAGAQIHICVLPCVFAPGNPGPIEVDLEFESLASVAVMWFQPCGSF